jgi:hypothetical protein
MFCTRRNNDCCTESLGNLNGSKTYTAGSSMDENPVASLDIRASDQSAVARRRGNKKACCFEETPSFRHGFQCLFSGGYLRCVSALRSAEYPISNSIPRCSAIWERGRDRDDHAGEFGAGDPWEGWLMLVFSGDLEEVEEIGCGGVDFY